MFNSWLENNLATHHTSTPKSDHLPIPPPGEPLCTCSEMVAFFDDKLNKVAMAHQYKRPNGTIGASGKPDPKYFFNTRERIQYKLRLR